MEKEHKETGKKSHSAREAVPSTADEEGLNDGDGGGGNVQELLRRAMTLGFSGFFATEATIRSALGNTLPKEWVDFAGEQGERTRQDIIERMAREFGRVIENLDVADVLRTLLDGHELEVNARFRLVPGDDEPDETDAAGKKTPRRPSAELSVSQNKTKAERKT
jgi:hypothetical protein